MGKCAIRKVSLSVLRDHHLPRTHTHSTTCTVMYSDVHTLYHMYSDVHTLYHMYSDVQSCTQRGWPCAITTVMYYDNNCSASNCMLWSAVCSK